MTTSFTAIDFETAHGKRWSICQVGLVRVENGIIIEKLSILVQPPNNFYWNKFIAIHGITHQQTAHAPTFEKVWNRIEPFIKNQNVVAHNGFSFDFHCISQALEYYDILVPDYFKHCTYKIYRDNLASLCMKHQIPLNHHDALSDALACAELYELHLNYLTINQNNERRIGL
jgi:DNA polymerase III subunit epsilon